MAAHLLSILDRMDGCEITYTPNGGASLVLSGLFQAYSELTGDESVDLVISSPVLLVRTQDIPETAVGDQFTIEAVVYEVAVIRPDEEGIYRINAGEAMSHARTQIRQAVIALLKGNTSAGNNVFEARVYHIDDLKLPALLVCTKLETLSEQSMSHPRTQQRRLRLSIEVYVKARGKVDEDSDHWHWRSSSRSPPMSPWAVWSKTRCSIPPKRNFPMMVKSRWPSPFSLLRCFTP
jgi:hypothetical protein